MVSRGQRDCIGKSHRLMPIYNTEQRDFKYHLNFRETSKVRSLQFKLQVLYLVDKFVQNVQKVTDHRLL